MVISDAAIQRVDLQDLSENLQWADDGSIAINTTSQLTILKPRYQKDGVKSANQLFDVHKIDIDKLPRSEAYRSQPLDERTSTLFSSADDFIVSLLWSPLTLMGESLLACLMGSKIIHIIQGSDVKITLGTAGICDTQADLNDTLTYSLDWLKVDECLYLFAGQASGNVKVYKIDVHGFTELHSIKVTEGTEITQVKVNGNFLAAVSSDNEIFQVDNILSNDKYEVKRVKDKQRAMIYDIHINSQNLFMSSPLKFEKYDLVSGSISEVSTDIYEYCKIIPNGPYQLLISNTKTVQLDKELNTVLNDKLSSAKSKRINKWNSKSESISLKNSTFKIYGVDYNFSGGILAVLYEISNDVGFKYKITSESLYKIAFINLDNQFPRIGSSLAVHQEFILSGKVPNMTSSSNSKANKTRSGNLKDYLRTSVLHDAKISRLMAANIISRDKDLEIRTRYCQLLVDYINGNKLKLENPFDKATHKYLLETIGQGLPGRIGTVVVASNVFEEPFNIDNNEDPETLVSESNHTWNRCAITFLPIISTDVKVDPVTQRRIIDVSKDHINEYGEFTRTILESLNEISIYSGCRFESKC